MGTIKIKAKVTEKKTNINNMIKNYKKEEKMDRVSTSRLSI
jgi:hypothetical protein